MRLAMLLVTGGAMLCVSPCAADAQGPWSVLVAGGAAGFGGASRVVEPVPGAPEQFKPAPTVSVHIAVERDLGRVSARVAFGYAQASLGGYGGGAGASINIDPGASLYEAQLLAGYRLARFDNGSRLTVRAGPLLQIWEGDFTLGTQYRWGGLGALSITAPLTRTVSVEVEGRLSLAGSPFVPENFAGLPANYDIRSLWTRELSVALRYRP